MNLLFVSNLYPPNVVGGYERLCSDVAQACCARNHRVTVLTSCHGRRISRHPGQIVHQALQLLVGKTVYQGFAGSQTRRDAVSQANVTALRRVIDLVKPDKIFCWNLYGLDLMFLGSLFEVGIPVVFMLTDNWLAAFFYPNFVDRYFQTEVFSPGEEPGRANRLDQSESMHLPCDAIFGAHYMESFYAQAGLTFNDSRVVHNGVELLMPPDAVFADRGLTRQGGTFRLLFAGRIVLLKGLRTAIEALPLLNMPGQNDCRVTLTVVGDSRDVDYLREIRELIAALGVTQDVVFLPTVAENELFELFQAYDAYVFPSLYEPFSLTLIHALAAGIPTVASAVGGNVEIVRDGETGLLFGRNDAAGLARAVRALIDQPGLRQALSANARAVSAGFTFERMVDQMLAFLAD